MNREKWTDPNIPLGVLIAKLAEETGEVANIYADAAFVSPREYIGMAVRMREEARHVKFIADRIIDNLKANKGGQSFYEIEFDSGD